MAADALSMLKFATPGAAAAAERRLEKVVGQGPLLIRDAATVSWPLGAKTPTTHQASPLAGGGELGDAFWGMLFGLVFFVPLIGAAVGAATGGVSGFLTDVGIDDPFINKVRDQVTPGTSALFVIVPDATLQRIRDELSPEKPNLVRTNLSREQEAALRHVFVD